MKSHNQARVVTQAQVDGYASDTESEDDFQDDEEFDQIQKTSRLSERTKRIRKDANGAVNASSAKPLSSSEHSESLLHNTTADTKSLSFDDLYRPSLSLDQKLNVVQTLGEKNQLDASLLNETEVWKNMRDVQAKQSEIFKRHLSIVESLPGRNSPNTNAFVNTKGNGFLTPKNANFNDLNPFSNQNIGDVNSDRARSDARTSKDRSNELKKERKEFSETFEKEMKKKHDEVNDVISLIEQLALDLQEIEVSHRKLGRSAQQVLNAKVSPSAATGTNLSNSVDSNGPKLTMRNFLHRQISGETKRSGNSHISKSSKTNPLANNLNGGPQFSNFDRDANSRSHDPIENTTHYNHFVNMNMNNLHEGQQSSEDSSAQPSASGSGTQIEGDLDILDAEAQNNYISDGAASLTGQVGVNARKLNSKHHQNKNQTNGDWSQSE